MRAVNSQELLDIWEHYHAYPVLDRSLFLLAALYNTDLESVAALSIGDRDARLLRFRSRIFGNRLRNLAHCPHCNGAVEWEMTAGMLRLQDIADTAEHLNAWQDGEYELLFRFPNSADLLRARNDPKHAVPAVFLKSCIESAKRNAEPIDQSELPQPVLNRVAERMSELEPGADIRMNLNCPECGNAWIAAFDIMRYLWTEIDSWARRLIGEIALLARAFGWNETEILALSPGRRKMYLDLITAR